MGRSLVSAAAALVTMTDLDADRRLVAVLCADVAGYSRMIGDDEEGTLAALTAHMTELVEPAIACHHGRIVKTTGDGFLAEFARPIAAAHAAFRIQEGLRSRNADVAVTVSRSPLCNFRQLFRPQDCVYRA